MKNDKGVYREGGFEFKSLRWKREQEQTGVASLARTPEVEKHWREQMFLHDHAEGRTLLMPQVWHGGQGSAPPRPATFADMVAPASRPLFEDMESASLRFWSSRGPEAAIYWKSEFWVQILTSDGHPTWASLEVLPFAFDLGGKVWATQGRLRVRHASRRLFPHLREVRTEEAALLTPEGELFFLEKMEVAMLRWLGMGVKKSKIAETAGLSVRTVTARLDRLVERSGLADHSELLRKMIRQD